MSIAAQPNRKNWAGNLECQAKYLYKPESAEEVRDLIKKLDRQKALGSRHCFNDIAHSPLNQISTQNLVKPIVIVRK